MLDSRYDGLFQYPQIVQDYWKNEPNYLIEYDECCDSKDYCAIYFCSNDIWFPHTEEIFRKRIVEKNFFEWYHCRIGKAYKHIFVRDIFKQWYLTGINGQINSPQKMLEFLKNETDGFKVITIGSSAGGYASALFGPKLKSEKSICFNAQFCLERLVKESCPTTSPLLFSIFKSNNGGAVNILNDIDSDTPIYYIYSDRSSWDVEQHEYTKGVQNVKCIEFNSSKHGIPFLKVALPKFINLEVGQLDELTRKVQHPLLFTIKFVGIYKTISGFVSQAYKAYKKRH